VLCAVIWRSLSQSARPPERFHHRCFLLLLVFATSLFRTLPLIVFDDCACGCARRLRVSALLAASRVSLKPLIALVYLTVTVLLPLSFTAKKSSWTVVCAGKTFTVNAATPLAAAKKVWRTNKAAEIVTVHESAVVVHTFKSAKFSFDNADKPDHHKAPASSRISRIAYENIAPDEW
jgi:hypothetical protein